MQLRALAPTALVVLVVATAAVAAVEVPCQLPTSTSSTPDPTSCNLDVMGAVEVSTTGGLGQVAVHEDLAAVVQRDDGRVALVDLTEPGAPVVVGTYEGGTGQASLDHPLDGDVAFSDDGTLLFHARQTSDWSNEGLHVLDVSDPTAPVRTDLAPQGGMLRLGYGRVGDREVVVTLDAINGMTIFEVLRTPVGARVVPLHVDPLPALKVGGPASAGVELIDEDPLTGGPLLVVTDGTTGLRLLDLSDPSQPQELGAWDQQGLAAVAVEHDDGRRLVHAAAEYWFDGTTPPELVTLDTTDPTAITEVARRNLGGYDGELAWKLGGLHLAGGELLVAHGHAGLVALAPDTGAVLRATTDLGTPTISHPTYGFLGWYAMDVGAHGHHVVVTDATTGELRVLERADIDGG